MAYINHRFCWHGAISTDVEHAKGFYADVIGWSVVTTPMGDGDATMFVANGIPRAHIMPPPMEGVPSHWNNYLRVESVDASADAAVANGGTLLVPPTDIPPGRFCAVTTPSGAMVSLFHEADEAQSSNAPTDDMGAFHWVELHSTDIDADLAWFKATFGITTEEMPMPNGGTYYLLVDGETRTGGAMQGMAPGAPSHFLAWAAVGDVDAAAARVTAGGGQLMTEVMDYEGVGRMVVATDPTGAVFGLITPAASA